MSKITIPDLCEQADAIAAEARSKIDTISDTLNRGCNRPAEALELGLAAGHMTMLWVPSTSLFQGFRPEARPALITGPLASIVCCFCCCFALSRAQALRSVSQALSHSKSCFPVRGQVRRSCQ
jgi:hypothetical protein